MNYLVAIPVFNEQEHLSPVLAAVREHTPDILVIKDASGPAEKVWTEC